MLLRSFVTALAACTLAACSADAGQHSGTPPVSLPSPPPATSGIDHTVSVRWQLADSFDVFPDGSCRGREDFGQMGAGDRAQLRGTTTGMVDETRATARLEDQTKGKSAVSDDGLYCVIRIVFAPTLPDPDGYWLKFPGSPQTEVRIGLDPSLGPSFAGGRPVRQPTLPPGYGRFNLGSQVCPSLLDPSDEECPVVTP